MLVVFYVDFVLVCVLWVEIVGVVVCVGCDVD